MTRIFLFLVSIVGFTTLVSAQSTPDSIREGDVEAARRVRRAELNDPFRPVWHLTIAEGIGMPFDPNGAIFKDGVYHLWHLYQAESGHQWQHLTSIDLFHWRWHAHDLMHRPGDPDEGIFSGNAFLAPDGNVVISYHGVGTGGNCVAYSSDKDLEHWDKSMNNPVAKPGWDPHMWYEQGRYYMISGGEPVSSGIPNPAVLYQGDDYKAPMHKLGNFLTKDLPGVDKFEDISCPDFFRMGNKWVLSCISHIRGARYYIGRWNGKQFEPETHHRMNWPGGSTFAPETLLDDKGRRILWAWVLDRRTGVSSGMMTMPRVLSLSDDQRSLRIEPPREVEALRYQPMHEDPVVVEKDRAYTAKNISGKVLEMDMVIDPGQASKFGIKVFCSKDGREQTPVVIDRKQGTLSIDMRQSSLERPEYREFVMLREPNALMEKQESPFTLKPGEKLHLRVFLDKSMLEVFANGRQCITQVVYPTLQDAMQVLVFTEDKPISVTAMRAWKLFPTMQW